MDTLELLFAVCDRPREAGFVKSLRQHGVCLLHRLLAQGTASSEMLDYLNLDRSEKTLLLAVVSSSVLPPLMRQFRRAQSIDIPGNGVVATVPLRCVAGQRTLALLTHGQPYERQTEESTMPQPTENELILVIANEGYTDRIMAAARQGGAGGGTVLRAKGTGADYARQFFGVTLAGEKELVMIIAPTQKRDGILNAIIAEAGPASRAQSIAFSLPVSSVAGLRRPEPEEEG